MRLFWDIASELMTGVMVLAVFVLIVMALAGCGSLAGGQSEGCHWIGNPHWPCDEGHVD